MFRWSWFPFNGSVLLALRNMRTRWVRSALTMMGIVVGVAAIVAVSATNASTLNSINRFFDEAAGQGDLLVEAAVSGQGFDDSALDVVSRFPEVVAAAPAGRAVTVPIDEEWQIQIGSGGATVPGSQFWLMGVDPEVEPQVHDYELVSGRVLEPGEEAYNVVLVETYAREKELQVGDDFIVAVPPNGEAKLRVVGLIAKKGVGVTNEGAVGFVPLPVVQDLFNLSGQITQIELNVAEEIAGDPDRLDALRMAIAARLDDKIDVTYPASRGEVVASTLKNYQLGLNFFSVVSLFVGSFLIYNAFAMTVVERTREIGMLRAVGSTRRQIMRMVLVEAIVLGVLGSLAGVVSGLLLARGLIVFMSGFTGRAIQSVSAAPESLVQAMAIGLLVTLGAATIPVFQAARISPLEALRVKGNVDEGRWFEVGLKFGPLTVLASWLVLYQVPFRQEVSFSIGSGTIFVLLMGATLCIPIFAGGLERVLRPGILFLFGNEGRLGSQNVNRAQGRTTLTVAALMVGISMVIGINGLTGSFETDIQSWVETAIGGDLYVRSPLGMRTDLEPRLLALDEVTAVTKTGYVPTRIVPPDGDEAYAVFIAIDPASYLAVSGLRIEEGPDPAGAIEQLAAGDAILVSAGVAGDFDLAVGEWVTLETRRGQRRFRVAAIIVDFSGGDSYVVTGSWGDLRRYFGVDEVGRYTVTLAPGAPLDTVATYIEEELGRGQSLSVETKEAFSEQVTELSGEAFALFDVLGLIGLVVAALGVVNTMLMNVLERTRELGGLRSLGMTRRQIRRMILAEAATMGIIGAVFGVIFGAVLADVFLLGLRQISGFILQKQIPVTAMIVSFFLAILVALGAALYPAARAGRVNIVEAIKNE